jgi:hypothetical protein
VYVFGVASLAALAIVIVSGFAIAIGGPDWWHTHHEDSSVTGGQQRG